MGITSGCRVLINDLKYNSDCPTAIAICINRNSGINSIEV
jgi:hypothetical protein